MKKALSLVLAVLMLLGCVSIAGCGDGGTADLMVGAILVGDETEGYTLAHMNGIEGAIKNIKSEMGKTVKVSYKKKIPEDETVATNAADLISSGCTLIITNSYGHQFHFGEVMTENPDIDFVAMTGDLAGSVGSAHYANAFTKVYESRFVSGVVAGKKLEELLSSGKLSPATCPDSYDSNGNIKIGYVGAFNYAEVVSGYTAFYLGVKSVVSNVVMTVKYTNSWFSEEREAAVAEYLMGLGCVIIGQHADSTGAPAAVQKAYNTNKDLVCYEVGYNVSMLDAAPDIALTSATNNWEVYYTALFKAILNGEATPQEWAEGYSQNAVGITELGSACAAGTQEAADAAAKAISEGTLKVFDCSTFTVGGKNLTTYTGAYGMNGQEALKTENGVTFFDESSLRAAPYFDIRIDGITEVASAEYAD